MIKNINNLGIFEVINSQFIVNSMVSPIMTANNMKINMEKI